MGHMGVDEAMPCRIHFLGKERLQHIALAPEWPGLAELHVAVPAVHLNVARRKRGSQYRHASAS